jgi:IS30 family transposase
MSYSHLSASERWALYQYHKQEHLTLSAISLKMNRSKSTISRELRRNSLNRVDYLPDSAQLKMQQRREQSKHKFMSIRPSTIAQVKHQLQQYHSPEQMGKRYGHWGESRWGSCYPCRQSVKVLNRGVGPE